MRMQEHMAYSGVVGVGAWYLWGPWNAVVFWLAAVLIDTDHYLDHIVRTRGSDWNVKSIFKLDAYFRPRLARGELQGKTICMSIFHTVEVFLAVYMVGVWSREQIVFVVLAGMLFHMFLDIIYLVQNHAPFIRAFSLIEYVIRCRRMRSRGIEPNLVFEEAYRTLGIIDAPSGPRSIEGSSSS